MTDLSKSEQELVQLKEIALWLDDNLANEEGATFERRKEIMLEAFRKVRSHVNASVGAAVEACAKELNAELESIKDEDAEVRAIQRLLKARTRIRTLYPAATEELEQRMDAAKESAMPLACKAIIESLDGGEFSPASPLAKVKAEVLRRLAKARAGMREACAGHYPVLEDGPSDSDVLAYLCCQCGDRPQEDEPSDVWWGRHIRKLPDTAAAEAIEKVKAAARLEEAEWWNVSRLNEDYDERIGILRGLRDMHEGKTQSIEQIRNNLTAAAKETP